MPVSQKLFRSDRPSARAQGDVRTRNPGKGLRDHEYDHDDDFIDDSEMLAYLGGDRRRTKHSGFFINKVRAGMFSAMSGAPLQGRAAASAWLRRVAWGCKESDAAVYQAGSRLAGQAASACGWRGA